MLAHVRQRYAGSQLCVLPVLRQGTEDFPTAESPWRIAGLPYFVLTQWTVSIPWRLKEAASPDTPIDIVVMGRDGRWEERPGKPIVGEAALEVRLPGDRALLNNGADSGDEAQDQVPSRLFGSVDARIDEELNDGSLESKVPFHRLYRTSAEHPDMKPRIEAQRHASALVGANRTVDLDDYFESLRKGSLKSPSGSSLLHAAYEGLSSELASAGADRPPRDFLEDWKSLRPRSPTPRVALARLIVTQAEALRKSRAWNRMSQTQRHRYTAKLEDARRVLEADGRLALRCPEGYAVMEDVLGPQGAASGEYLAFLEDVARNVPWYAPLTNDLIYRLVPKWGGEPDGWEAFGRRLASSDARRPDWEPYARMAWEASSLPEYGPAGANLFKLSKLKWTSVREGFVQMLRRYPKSKALPHAFALLACLAGDRETASGLFGTMGLEGDETIWGNVVNFHYWRNWAQGKQPPKPRAPRWYPTNIDLASLLADQRPSGDSSQTVQPANLEAVKADALNAQKVVMSVERFAPVVHPIWRGRFSVRVLGSKGIHASIDTGIEGWLIDGASVWRKPRGHPAEPAPDSPLSKTGLRIFPELREAFTESASAARISDALRFGSERGFLRKAVKTGAQGIRVENRDCEDARLDLGDMTVRACLDKSGDPVSIEILSGRDVWGRVFYFSYSRSPATSYSEFLLPAGTRR